MYINFKESPQLVIININTHEKRFLVIIENIIFLKKNPNFTIFLGL